MACHHPLDAWRYGLEKPILGKDRPPKRVGGKEPTPLSLPCGSCLGCQMDTAKGWALRCTLELMQHETASFTTLTYDQKHEPITLSKRHLQLYLKRLRKAYAKRYRRSQPLPVGPIRFFASGEYGETRGRPHYHAILYGLDPATDQELLNKSWGLGFTTSTHVTPERIAYVAGYCAKKIGWRTLAKQEAINYNTGELYTWQPPFIQMSRGGRGTFGGIGSNAKKYTNSWRDYAVLNGIKIATPRYLHEAWKAAATPEEIQALQIERTQRAAKRDDSQARLDAAEHIARARQALAAYRRTI